MTFNPGSSADPVSQEFLKPFEKHLLKDGYYEDSLHTIIKINYKDNPFFPDNLEQLRLKHKETKSKAEYAHIWEGEYEPRAIGALWDRKTIQEYRRTEIPPMGRIVVSVDPPKKSDEGSNQAGIVVAGQGQDGRGYVIHDASRVASPEQWAKAAIALYDHYDADAIVAEVNNGGEMVKQTIHSIRNSIRVIEVTATRGKHIRAEPISSLYSMGSISHIGSFPELERQMCLITASGWEGPDNESPDRLDAMVWAFTELFPRLTRKTEDRKRRPLRQNNRYNPHRLHQ